MSRTPQPGMQIKYWAENLKTVYLGRRKARWAFWSGDLNLITLRHNKDVIKQIGPTTHNLNEFFSQISTLFFYRQTACEHMKKDISHKKWKYCDRSESVELCSYLQSKNGHVCSVYILIILPVFLVLRLQNKLIIWNLLSQSFSLYHKKSKVNYEKKWKRKYISFLTILSFILKSQNQLSVFDLTETFLCEEPIIEKTLIISLLLIIVDVKFCFA